MLGSSNDHPLSKADRHRNSQFAEANRPWFGARPAGFGADVLILEMPW